MFPVLESGRCCSEFSLYPNSPRLASSFFPNFNFQIKNNKKRRTCPIQSQFAQALETGNQTHSRSVDTFLNLIFSCGQQKTQQITKKTVEEKKKWKWKSNIISFSVRLRMNAEDLVTKDLVHAGTFTWFYRKYRIAVSYSINFFFLKNKLFRYTSLQIILYLMKKLSYFLFSKITRKYFSFL